ncbi:MAG: putative DNA binding domain-containing protein [Thermomicrobiales bacterium]
MSGVYSAEFVALLDELGEAESLDLEFKEAGGGIPHALWETICAFANTSGGTFVLGVTEQQQNLVVAGVPHLQQRLDDLHSQSRNQRKISHDVLSSGNVSVRSIDGKDVIIIAVRAVDRRSRPVYVNGQLSTGTYLRRHSGDFVASEHEIRQMMREAVDLSPDQVILPWADITMLDREAIDAYRRRLIVHSPSTPWVEYSEIQLLSAIEGYRKDLQTQEEGVTVAGLLMFGRTEHIRAWRTRHLIDARSLPRGADLSEPDWTDRVTWEVHVGRSV